MLTIGRIKRTVARVCKKYGVSHAYLFGSYAKGMAHDGSDVDIMIDMENMRDYKKYFNFCEELKDELGTDVDVMAEKYVLPAFRSSIMDGRMLIYAE